MTIPTEVISGRVRRLVPDRLPAIVAPFNPVLIGGTVAPVIGTIYGCRVVVPKSGNIRDLAAYHGAVSGNHRLGIYDTGDAAAGVRTLLWDSGSIAVATANSWQVAGDPNLPVLAGRQLDFVSVWDNTTVQMGRWSIQASSAQFSLPASYWPASGGALPKVAWAYAAGAYAALPATISEANCGVASGVQYVPVIGRIS